MGRLDVREAKWTEVVNGGTTLTGKVTVPDNPIVASAISLNTEPLGSAIYATLGDGSISFGGPIINREWDDTTNTLTITAVDWKAWLYRVIVGPKIGVYDPWIQTFTNTEQLTIARSIVQRVDGTFNNGAPVFDVANYVSGVNRSYILTGTEFKTAGQHLDHLGGLSNSGFEWEVEPVFANDGLPKPRVQFYRPQRGGVVGGLVFRKTPEGGNILKIDELVDDASAVTSRVWAIGEGPDAASTPWGVDEDPVLSKQFRLRTDIVSQYNLGLTVQSLTSYARTERTYRAAYLSGLTFSIRMDSPSITSYTKGDRCRIVVRDRFLNIDVKNCRILAREMDPDNNLVKLTVNLNDLMLPEIDEDGAV